MERQTNEPRAPRMAVLAVLFTFLNIILIASGAQRALARPHGQTPVEPTAIPTIELDFTRALADGGDRDGDGVVDPGDVLTYTVEVTNAGLAPVGPVEIALRVDEDLSGAVTGITAGGRMGEGAEVVWDLDELPVGETITLTSDVTLRTIFPPGRSTWFDTAVALTPEGIELARAMGLPLEVVGPVLEIEDISYAVVTDANSDGTLDAGDTIRLTVSYANSGGGDSFDATLFLDYPEEMVFQIVGNPDEGLDDGSALVWTLGTVPADGETHQVQFDLQLATAMPPGMTTVDFDTEIRSGGFTLDSLTTSVELAGASLVLEVDDEFTLDQQFDLLGATGDEVQLTVTLINVGNEIANDVTITADTNERLVEIIEASSDGRIDSQDGSVTWFVPLIEPGTRITVTIDMRIQALPEGLPVLNFGLSAVSADTPLSETQHSIPLDTTPLPEPVPDERPTLGDVPLQTILVLAIGAAAAFAAYNFIRNRRRREPTPVSRVPRPKRVRPAKSPPGVSDPASHTSWKDYQDFVLKIERADGDEYRVEVQGPTGEGTGRFKLPFDERDLKIFLLEIGRPRQTISRGRVPEPVQTTVDFGQKLYEAVFRGEVRERFATARREMERVDQGLRLKLRLSDAPELANLPWEYLYDGRDFLALSDETPVVRYLDLPASPRPIRIAPPLRILVTISAPHNLAALDVEEEQAKIEEALAGLLARDLVEIDYTPDATLITLQRTLRRAKAGQRPYHVWHFIGHGGFDAATQSSVLMLTDDAGMSHPVGGFQIGMLFNAHPELRLALLNACEGARPDREDPFAGVAASLVQQEVPAVIGMQFEITDRAAITFAGEFYTALVDGLPVDAALVEARRAVFFLPNWVEWATPVLFMRVKDGRLYDIE